MVNYGEALSKALKFCIQPKRWLPFFILDLAFFLLVAWFVLSNLSVVISVMLAVSTSPLEIISVLGYVAILAVGFIIWGLLRLWIQGAVVHQSYKEKEIKKSFRIACQRYLSLLGVMIIVTIVSAGVNFVPWIGWILSIIVTLIFFFVFQSVIVGRLRFEKALVDSYNMFRKKPLSVFLAWLVTAIIATVITCIFAIPSIMMIWNAIVPYLSQLTTTTAAASVLFVLLTNSTILIAGGIVFLIGIAISTAFSLKAQTEFYIQLRKRRLF